MTQLSTFGGFPRDPQAGSTRVKRALRRLAAQPVYGPTLETTSTNVTPVANVGIGETTLMSYTIPANLLTIKPGDCVQVDWLVSFATNLNAKRVAVYVGSQIVYDSGGLAQNGGSMVVRLKVYSLTPTTQRIVCQVSLSASAAIPHDATYTDGTQAATGNILVKLTGQSGSVSGDVTAKTMQVQIAPN